MRKFEGYDKGANLGGWLSQCVHSKAHYDTFITEKDIEILASWGIDHVRVPVDFEVLETIEGAYIEAGFTYIDNCLTWCDKYHLNMILDLHKTAGYSFDELTTSDGFFEDEILQQRFLHLWEQFAQRYGKLSDRLAFELLNEIVSDKFIHSWNGIARRAVETIRGFAPDIRILIGGVWYNSVNAVKYLDMPYDRNIVYNFHCYDPMLFTHQSAYWVADMPADLVMEYPSTLAAYIEGSKILGETMSMSLKILHLKTMGPELFDAVFTEAVKIAEERDVPLYCGEYGVIDNAPLESTLNWYRDIHSIFEKHGIGRAVWSYKKMDFGLIDSHYAPIFDELVKLL